jgi:hypothetical protein
MTIISRSVILRARKRFNTNPGSEAGMTTISRSVTLIDRKHYKLPVIAHCSAGFTTIYNANTLSLLDMWRQIKRLAPKSALLSFTTETTDETAHVLRCMDSAINGEETHDLTGGGYTHGHFRAPVD